MCGSFLTSDLSMKIEILHALLAAKHSSSIGLLALIILVIRPWFKYSIPLMLQGQHLKLC